MRSQAIPVAQKNNPVTAKPAESRQSPVLLVTVNEGEFCNYVFLDGTKLVQRSTLDIGINNNSNRDIMLTSVKLEPVWVTGDFSAGELNPTKQYDITVDRWLEMVKVAQGYLESKEYNKDSLIRERVER